MGTDETRCLAFQSRNRTQLQYNAIAIVFLFLYSGCTSNKKQVLGVLEGGGLIGGVLNFVVFGEESIVACFGLTNHRRSAVNMRCDQMGSSS